YLLGHRLPNSMKNYGSLRMYAPSMPRVFRAQQDCLTIHPIAYVHRRRCCVIATFQEVLIALCHPYLVISKIGGLEGVEDCVRSEERRLGKEAGCERCSSW